MSRAYRIRLLYKNGEFQDPECLMAQSQFYLLKKKVIWFMCLSARTGGRRISVTYFAVKWCIYYATWPLSIDFVNNSGMMETY